MSVLEDVARALNKVKTAGQARVAAGKALVYINTGYKIIDEADFDTKSDKLALDALHRSITDKYKALPVEDSFVLSGGVWDSLRRDISGAFINVVALEQTAGYTTTYISVLNIIGESIEDAPKVIGKAVGATVAGVGSAAGGLIGGLFSGLGIWGIAILGIGAFLLFRTAKAA